MMVRRLFLWAVLVGAVAAVPVYRAMHFIPSSPITRNAIYMKGVPIFHDAKGKDCFRASFDSCAVVGPDRTLPLIATASINFADGTVRGDKRLGGFLGTDDCCRGGKITFSIRNIPNHGTCPVSEIVRWGQAEVFYGDAHTWQARRIDTDDGRFHHYIGPQTALFRIISRISLPFTENGSANRCDHDHCSKYRVDYYALARAYGPSMGFAFILCGIFTCGLICSFKGLDGGSDWMLFGGWLAAAISAVIATVWIIAGHLPLAYTENVVGGLGIDAPVTRYSRIKYIYVPPFIEPLTVRVNRLDLI